MKEKKTSPLDSIRGLSYVTQFGFTIIVGVVGGVLGGRWLDKKFDISPLFLLLGLFFGLAAGVFNIVKLVKPMTKERNENDSRSD